MPEIPTTNGHVLEANGSEPMWEAKSVTIQLLEAVLKMAYAKQISSIALVMIPTQGEFQVTAAGPDIDGLHAGSKALEKQLRKLVIVGT